MKRSIPGLPRGAIITSDFLRDLLVRTSSGVKEPEYLLVERGEPCESGGDCRLAILD